MGALLTAFTNAFKTAANTNPADCQALGTSIENYVAAPRTHNANSASSPTSAPSGYVRRAIGSDSSNASDQIDAFAGVPTFNLRRANNTGASPTAIASADIIGRLNFSGWYVTGGPGYATAPASMRGVATENWTSTAQGAKLVLSATLNGSSSPSDYWTLDNDGKLTGISPLGYATGAGGTVTQVTSKTTGVTLNKSCGDVTMNNAALGAGSTATFRLTNSLIAATDQVVLSTYGGTIGAYTLNGRCGAGYVDIDVTNRTGGSLSEAAVIRFTLLKAATS